jgi:hypothetical protein
MATPHPLDHLLIVIGFIRKSVQIQVLRVATATLTLILEFNLTQEEAISSRRRTLAVGALQPLLDTTRAFKTVLELPARGARLQAVSDVLGFASLPC